MNSLKNITTVLAMLTLLCFACSKDDDSGDNNNNNPGANEDNYFACKIDGVDWKANGISQPTVTLSEISADVSSRRLDFSGQSDGGETIAMVVVDFAVSSVNECLNDGTFYGKDHPDAGDAFMVTSGGTTYSNESYIVVSASLTREGTVEITDCGDGKISGTFEYTVKDLSGAVVHEITEGFFNNIEYDFF